MKETPNYFFFLCRGLNAKPEDLDALEAAVKHLRPNSEVYRSKIDILTVWNKIEDMRKTLASEAKELLSAKVSENPNLKIILIGTSLGGLLLKLIVPELKNLEPNLFAYISLCSPHFGSRSNSKLMNFCTMVGNCLPGMNFVKDIKLAEKNPNLFFSETKYLFEVFEHVVLVGLELDGLVDKSSALMSEGNEIDCKDPNGIGNTKIIRITSNYLCPNSFNNSILGTDNHNLFLRNKEALLEVLQEFNFFLI